MERSDKSEQLINGKFVQSGGKKPDFVIQSGEKKVARFGVRLRRLIREWKQVEIEAGTR